MKKTYSRAMRKYLTTAIISASVMLVFAVLTTVFDWSKYFMAVVEAALAVFIICYVTVVATSRKKTIAKYMHNITGNEHDFSENIMESVPLPMAICSVDGTIRWYNNRFSKIFHGEKLAHESLDDCIKSLKWSDVLKHPNGKDITEKIDDKIYSVRWSLMKDNTVDPVRGDHYSVFFYLKDITGELDLKRRYLDERVDVATVSIDNLDEFYQKVDDETADAGAARIRNAIFAWARLSDSVIKKIDRDRYFVAFEHKNLDMYIKDNFTVVENVAKLAEEIKFPISVSIGIGTGGNLVENEEGARQALDVALGRGGSQACVKDGTEFKFYGSAKVEYERSTRVKARSVAVALTDLIKHSKNVIFMGHTNADFDCFGAAVGLQRLVRDLGVKPYIVHERISPAVDHMYYELCDLEEYSGMFIDEIDVLDVVSRDSLLIILDTHHPSMLPNTRLLDVVENVVVIDHHRRSAEFISPCALVYHEPYASSTCEMVTELLRYMNTNNAVTKEEAQCLYTGILMDTKNFILKTGVRTFEAASYLRKLGLDTVSVRKMFSSHIEDYTRKAEIVSQTELIAEGVALSQTFQTHKNIRMIASQAADEMLNLNGVKASVVVFPEEGGVGFSARSLGTVNVQLIMEALGGGGHMTVAGATMAGMDVEGGISEAKRVIKEYLHERKEK